jgi:transposase-like protein
MRVPTRPGRPCTCCTSEHHRAIDLALCRGVAIKEISRRYGVTADALYRHQRSHIRPQTIRAGMEQREDAAEAHVGSLALDARKLRAKAIALLLRAEAAGELQTALKGVREATNCLIAEARILGEIDNGPPVSVSVESQPQVVVILPSNGREAPEIIGTAEDAPAIPYEPA